MDIPLTLKYTKDHEWVQSEGETLTSGITDFAQRELGDVVYVELPSPGTAVSKGKPMAVVESVKAASDVYAPVSGTIEAVNTVLQNAPDTINSDPYGAGWLVKIRPAALDELNTLLDAANYTKLVS